MVETDQLHQIRVEEQDLSSADLELTPDTGESIEILARGIDSGGDEDVIEERIEEVAMLNYPADEGDDEVFPRDLIDNRRTDILGLYRQMGMDLPTLKVPAGSTYQLDNPDDTGTAVVLYRDLNREAFNPTQPGGSESSQRVFISVAQVTDSIATDSTEDHPIDTSVNIGGIQDWPWEEDVPSNREYDVVALMCTLDNSAGADISLDNIRLRANEQDFIEADSQFVRSELFQYPNNVWTTRPWSWVDPTTGEPAPITFSPGDDLTVRYEATNANTASSQDAIVNATLIARERRL